MRTYYGTMGLHRTCAAERLIITVVEKKRSLS